MERERETVFEVEPRRRLRVSPETETETETSNKRLMVSPETETETDWLFDDLFERLSDDLVLLILSALSNSASCPADFTSLRITCKRLNKMELTPIVLKNASPDTFEVKARNWSEDAHRFVWCCAHAGNVEAAYYLGMIHFYCLGHRSSGFSLIRKAAMTGYPAALHSLAIFLFNGSGCSKHARNPSAGVRLCTEAASRGHRDALREIGHCLQEGYGVRKNVLEGSRLIYYANTHELALALNSGSKLTWEEGRVLSGFGCVVPPVGGHPANKFLVEWFGLRGGEVGEGMKVCAHPDCGRPETRKNEHRRCPLCNVASYCTRSCQVLHWKIGHKEWCVPVPRVEG